MMISLSKLADDIREAYSTICSESGEEVVLPGQPAPAARPVVYRNGGIGYGKTYERWRRDVQGALDAMVDRIPTDDCLLVVVEFVVEKAKTSKLNYPRGDVDDFLKGPLDAITRARHFWIDDNQIILATTVKRFADKGENPHVRVNWYRYGT